MQFMDALESTTNPFGGVIPRPEALPSDPEQFLRQLQHSLVAWRRDGFKVAWLELPISRASLVPAAVEAGFSYHHATGDYLLLTLQLVENAVVPGYASHYIGAGGVVLNADRELLVVRESRGNAGPSRSFKLPGGALHHGEHLEDAVVREVFEETGVRTRFEAVICLRNQHGYRHGKSDIYFVCRLAPLSHEITIQADEIDECLWMPVDRYLESESVSPFNKRIVEAAMRSPGLAPTGIEGYTDRDKYEFFIPMEMSDGNP